MCKQLRPLWVSEDKRVNEMEENAHCPSPEKLSLLAFCLSMNSLYLPQNQGRSLDFRGDRAAVGRAQAELEPQGHRTDGGRVRGDRGTQRSATHYKHYWSITGRGQISMKESTEMKNKTWALTVEIYLCMYVCVITAVGLLLTNCVCKILERSMRCPHKVFTERSLGATDILRVTWLT